MSYQKNKKITPKMGVVMYYCCDLGLEVTGFGLFGV